MKFADLPADLVVLAMIAGFLVLRLRSILGRRTGFEGASSRPAARPAPAPTIDAQAEPVPAASRRLPEPDSAAGEALAAMARADRSFEPGRFLTGAEAAFRLIVAAFAAGDRARLRPLLTPETLTAFERAIADREAAGETQTGEIRRLVESAIDGAVLAGMRAAITVRFLSEQVNRVTDAEGRVRPGTDLPQDHADLWRFERDLGTRDPAWRLASAVSG